MVPVLPAAVFASLVSVGKRRSSLGSCLSILVIVVGNRCVVPATVVFEASAVSLASVAAVAAAAAAALVWLPLDC